MTLKQIFQKVEAYNEIAGLMQTNKARIYFVEYAGSSTCSWGDYFTNYSDLRKYIRKTYIKPVADAIIACDEWDFDKEVALDCGDRFCGKYVAELVA
jgi:hypothetical protein